MPFQIGDKVWRFDENRRKYRSDERGRATGGPIYAEHFYLCEIIGETRVSWIVNGSNPPLKTPKKEPRGIYTDEQKAGMIWARSHRYKIVGLVERCSPEQLRQIAEIVGYEATE